MAAHFVILFSDDGRFCLRPFAASIAAYVAVLPGCQDPELCTHLVSLLPTSSSYFDVRWKGEGGETVPASIPVRGCSTLISAFFSIFKIKFQTLLRFGFWRGPPFVDRSTWDQWDDVCCSPWARK
jgi:hypothetical protein